MPYSGSCLCGGVVYEINGDFIQMAHCHCSMCRKSHGAAFVTFAVCKRSDFSWAAGKDLIARYESSPGNLRAFCSCCGGNVPLYFPGDTVGVPAGSLDQDPGIRPEFHVYAASKLPWHDIEDGLLKYTEYTDSELMD